MGKMCISFCRTVLSKLYKSPKIPGAQVLTSKLVEGRVRDFTVESGSSSLI